MPSIFSGLPNNLIIKIVQIENDRRKHEEKKKFGEVIQELNKLSSRYCDLDEGYWYGRPWVRRTRAADIVDLVAEFFDDI